MTSVVESSASAEERRDALVGRLFEAAIGSVELACLYLGVRLGLYEAVRERGPLTAAELARHAGIHERYAREWLEQQAAAAILDVDDASAPADARRYTLPAGHDEALLSESSLAYVAPLGLLHVACTLPIHRVEEAFKTGGGVPYADYGEDLHEGQAAFTRPLFEHLLAKEWLPAVPEIHERLTADPPARIADLACGHGRSSLALARGYPKVQVDGIDLDEASIERADAILRGSGVEDRVSFHHRDAADPALAGRYDVVTIFEALHDMSDPVSVLKAARALLRDGGSVFIADERVGEEFTAPAEELERFYYSVSVLHCLPVGMVGDHPAGTGTVMRPQTVRRYAREAEFSRVDDLPIEHDFWRFYRLVP